MQLEWIKCPVCQGNLFKKAGTARGNLKCELSGLFIWA